MGVYKYSSIHMLIFLVHEFLLKIFTLWHSWPILKVRRCEVRQPKALNRIRASLIPGQVYRRSDLLKLSSSIDRQLAVLVAEGKLKKLAQGLYAVPRSTPFGDAPPEPEALLPTFLKDDHFVVYGPSQFNALGLGTTQLYNRLVVFNRKRVGEFTLGGRKFWFHRWREAPKRLTPEFLVVELLNRLNELSEDRVQILERLQSKLHEFQARKLRYAATHYGTVSTRNTLRKLMEKRTGAVA